MRRCGYTVGKVLVIAVVALLQLTSCLKNEVKVSVELPKDSTDAYRLLYYASDPKKGWYAETVIPIQKGKGEAVCYTRNPTIVFVMHTGNVPEAAFYAERGDRIKITGTDGNPLSWDIGGNKINKEWSGWRIKNKDILSARDSGKINKAVAGYVENNTDKPLSAILLLIYYNRRIDEAGFLKLWKKLKGDALKPEWAQIVGRCDMPEGVPEERLKVSQLILHTAGTGADTIGIGNNPVLLYFWRAEDQEREENMALLRQLRKDIPDSAKNLIGDISFEMDSLSWRNGLSRDSLQGVVRGWMPVGEADSVVMRLGVTRTPYVLVYDKKGREVYRGDDVSKASGLYKKIKSVK